MLPPGSCSGLIGLPDSGGGLTSIHYSGSEGISLLRVVSKRRGTMLVSTAPRNGMPTH